MNQANQEIERKFAIKYIPKDLKIEKIYNIEQNFIYRDGITSVRLRKITPLDDKSIEYIYTVKTMGDIIQKEGTTIGQRYEIEKKISEEKYLELLKTKIFNTINKTRIVISIENNLKAEIDIYYDYLDGLITLEVEFENKEMAESFNIPDWFGEELGFNKLSNGKLSRMTKDEFESKVTKEFMDNNRKVIEQLNKVINFKT